MERQPLDEKMIDFIQQPSQGNSEEEKLENDSLAARRLVRQSKEWMDYQFIRSFEKKYGSMEAFYEARETEREIIDNYYDGFTQEFGSVSSIDPKSTLDSIQKFARYLEENRIEEKKVEIGGREIIVAKAHEQAELANRFIQEMVLSDNSSISTEETVYFAENLPNFYFSQTVESDPVIQGSQIAEFIANYPNPENLVSTTKYLAEKCLKQKMLSGIRWQGSTLEECEEKYNVNIEHVYSTLFRSFFGRILAMSKSGIKVDYDAVITDAKNEAEEAGISPAELT